MLTNVRVVINVCVSWLGCRLAYANALLRMITEFSGLYPFVLQYVLHANEDTYLAIGVCMMAFTRLLGVPVATWMVRCGWVLPHCRSVREGEWCTASRSCVCISRRLHCNLLLIVR